MKTQRREVHGIDTTMMTAKRVPMMMMIIKLMVTMVTMKMAMRVVDVVEGVPLDVTRLQELGRLGARQLGCYDAFTRGSHPLAIGAQFQTLDGDSYLDHIQEPYRPVNERLISNRLFQRAEAASLPLFDNAAGSNLLLLAFANLLTHDVSHLAQESEAQGYPTETLSIVVPEDDPVFPNGTVLTTTRALPNGRVAAVRPAPRVHDNQVSGFLDMQSVVGDMERRAFLQEGRRLRGSDQNLLPFNNVTLTKVSSFGTYQVHANSPVGVRFLSGDLRTTENPALTVVHHLLFWEFNRLSDAYHEAFPQLEDEEVFLAAWAILTAEIQSITYQEFLPELLGCDNAPAMNSAPSLRAEKEAIGMLHEFTTGAFRTIGHTAVTSFFPLVNATGSTEFLTLGESVRGVEARMLNGGVSNHLRGMLQFASGEYNRIIPEGLRSLNRPTFQRDLGALDILRYADVGAPSYLTIRHHLGLASITSWTNLTSDPVVVADLEDLFGGDFDAIPPFAAMMVEDDVGSSQVGETATAVIRLQFQELRNSDSCHFEHLFNREWFGALQAVTFTDIIESNTDVVVGGPNAFNIDHSKPLGCGYQQRSPQRRVTTPGARRHAVPTTR